MNKLKQVLYVYHCTTCQQRGNVHFADDSHDGDTTECAWCGAIVCLEWDGGVDADTENVDASTRLGSTPY